MGPSDDRSSVAPQAGAAHPQRAPLGAPAGAGPPGPAAGQDPPPRGLPLTPETKVRIPHLGGQTLHRERLMSALDSAVLGRPVTLVAAPAGFGKTSALAQWAEHTEHTVAWLTVDEFDSDPRRLFRNLVAALQAVALAAGRADTQLLLELAPLEARGHSAARWPDQLDGLLRALEALRGPLVLVLDDLHALTGHRARDLLAWFVRLSAPEFRLVISTRSDPDLPLHRLRLAGELGEVRERDLAFSASELRALAGLAGHSLAAEEAQALTALTRGWPAAVRMAIFMVDHEPAAGRLLAGMRGGDLPLTEYLTEEVLGALRPDLARFVLCATTGDRIDAGLADLLHDGDGGAELLVEAAHAGVFLTPQPEADGELSYRWHEVFASQCRAILRRTAPRTAEELQRTAANYWRTRDAYESIAAALAAGDPVLASDVLTERWPELLLMGDPGAIGQLCDRILAPLSEDPEMLQLRAVGEILDGGSGDATMVRARSLAGRLPPGRRGRFDLVDALVTAFLAPARPAPEAAVLTGVEALTAATEAPAARALGHLLVGDMTGQLQHDLPAAIDHLRAGAALAAEYQLPAIALACQATLSVPLFLSGRFDAADSRARECIGRARRSGRLWAGVVVPAYLTCGSADYWRDDLADARLNLLQVVRLASSYQSGYRLHAAHLLVMIALAEDDVAAVDQALAVAAEHTTPTVTAGFARVVAAAAADARGDTEGALAHVRDLGPGEHHPIVRLWEAETLRRAGDADGAGAALAQIPASRRVAHVEVGATLTEALLAAGRGDGAAAHRRLEHALGVASRSGIRRPFRERSPDVRDLLHAHQVWGTQFVEFLADVLTRNEDHGDGHRRRSYWELTDRELTVLTYLRSQLTTTEIAAALFVSPNTVKTHMRAIYRKLGATGRRDAVRIAAAQRTSGGAATR